MYNNIFYELFDAEEHSKFIKSVEKQFRTSPEYSLWLNSVVHRHNCGATGLNKDADGIEIEVHHYRITLYNWVERIIDRFMSEHLNLNSHYICLILSDIHLNNTVPYIPLMHCIHKMIHNSSMEDVLLKYPDIINHIHNGDIDRAYEIIDYHIELLKDILDNENNNM